MIAIWAEPGLPSRLECGGWWWEQENLRLDGRRAPWRQLTRHSARLQGPRVLSAAKDFVVAFSGNGRSLLRACRARGTRLGCPLSACLSRRCVWAYTTTYFGIGLRVFLQGEKSYQSGHQSGWLKLSKYYCKTIFKMRQFSQIQLPIWLLKTYCKTMP